MGFVFVRIYSFNVTNLIISTAFCKASGNCTFYTDIARCVPPPLFKIIWTPISYFVSRLRCIKWLKNLFCHSLDIICHLSITTNGLAHSMFLPQKSGMCLPMDNLLSIFQSMQVSLQFSLLFYYLQKFNYI